MTIKSSQLSRITNYRSIIQNDVAMLAWKVYSTSIMTDDLYFDSMKDNSGIDFGRSIGVYIPPTGGTNGYFKYIETTSGVVDYRFLSNDDIVRKPLQSSIDTWVSDTIEGVLYQPSQGYYTWAAGRVTIRNRLNALNFPFDGNAVRFQFATGGSRSSSIDNVSFGKWKSGTDVGIDGTPTPLTFSGISNVTIPINSSVWSDWMAFDLRSNTDYVLVVDSATGYLRYAATNNQGFCMYEMNGNSYYIAEPDESYFNGGPPDYNTYVLPVCIECASNWRSGHFTSHYIPVSLGEGNEAPEVEPGCLVDLGDNGTGTIISISGDGSSNGAVTLDNLLETSTISGIYGSDFSFGSVTVTNSQGVVPSQPVATKGASTLRADTKSPFSWNYINIVPYQTSPGSSSIYHFVSLDSQSSWSVFSAGAWRLVVRYSNGFWQYNTSSTTTPNWVSADLNSDLSALKSTVHYPLNHMTATQLTAITPSQWMSPGGFSFGITSSMDLAFIMQSEGSDAPSIYRYIINYSIDTTNIFLVSRFWFASQNNPKSAFCLIYISTSDVISVGTDIQAFLSTNDGYDYDELTLSTIYSSGTNYYLKGVNPSLTPRANNIIRTKIMTFNQKDIHINAISVGLSYL